MITENEMWELVDRWIELNGEPNEAISSVISDDRGMKIKYSRIASNKLFETSIDVNPWLLRHLSESTIKDILKDLITDFRGMD
ncbi:MAG: hypothetical protein M0Q91_17490 [Methanoregula sp.]|jgi:hypothetical protein|nr:hypothetical protein [Methanoregula sp.]